MQPIVQRLHHKAYDAVSTARGDGTNPTRSDSASPRSPADAEKDKDHLHVFLGRTNVVSTKSGTQSQQQPAQQYNDMTPPETPYPYTSLHPSLADQLNTFDEHLASGVPLDYAQEQQAQYQPQGYGYSAAPPAEYYEQNARHLPHQHQHAPHLRTGSYSQHAQHSHTSSSHSPVEQWPAQGGHMLLPHTHAPSHHPQHPQSWAYPPSHPHDFPPHSALPAHMSHDPAYPGQPTYGHEPLQETWTSFMQQMELPRSPASMMLGQR